MEEGWLYACLRRGGFNDFRAGCFICLGAGMNYDKLRSVFAGAINQASEGKGAIRHGSGEPFEKQQICEISRRLAGHKCAGPLFQAVKKIYESGRLDKKAAIAELHGALNYIAAAIILLEE